jgi:broad specificity phosphatase PhoE
MQRIVATTTNEGSVTMTRRPRIYLVRHGETTWNAEGRLLSRTDEPINDRGERQATQAALDLASIRWDSAFASPLVRARRTAEVIVGARADAPPLSIDERLREVDFGPYEGWTDEQLEADPVAVTRRRDGAQLPGVEPDEEVAARARSFLEDLPRDGIGLVVGHGRMLRIMLALLLDLPPAFSGRLRMRNCRPAVVEPGSRPLLLALNLGDAAFEAH